MSTCVICYEELDEPIDLCHPICLNCFTSWVKECNKNIHKTVKCPYCRDIWKHSDDNRTVIYCRDCDNMNLVDTTYVLEDPKIKRYKDNTIYNLRYLYN